jgi:hypothetical protein
LAGLQQANLPVGVNGVVIVRAPHTRGQLDRRRCDFHLLDGCWPRRHVICAARALGELRAAVAIAMLGCCLHRLQRVQNAADALWGERRAEKPRAGQSVVNESAKGLLRQKTVGKRVPKGAGETCKGRNQTGASPACSTVRPTDQVTPAPSTPPPAPCFLTRHQPGHETSAPAPAHSTEGKGVAARLHFQPGPLTSVRNGEVGEKFWKANGAGLPTSLQFLR